MDAAPTPHQRRHRLLLVVSALAAVAGLAVPAVASTVGPPAASAPRAAALGRSPDAVRALSADAVATRAPSTTVASTVPAPPTTTTTTTVVPTTTTTSTTTAPATTTTTRPAPVRTSVDFGNGLVAEVVAPPGAGPHPMLVYVHGGGWVKGDHRELPAAFGITAGLADRGWAVVSVGYRLASRERGIDASDQVAEVIRILQWLRTDGNQLQLGGRMVALGHSAGGHLITLAATTMDPTMAPDAVIGVAGVYDFDADIQQSELLAAVLPDALGCAPDECPDGWLDALSPRTHADAADPPVVLVHGTDDPVVPHRTADDFATRLRDRGASVRSISVDGGDHYERLGPAVRAVLDELLQG